jgi:hypothetical protein
MVRRRRAAVLLACLFGALGPCGCATQQVVMLPAVGPIGPADSSAASRSDDPEAAIQGTLVVYSETLPVAKHRSPPVYAHTGYVLRRASGNRVATKVDNQRSEAEPDPEPVSLEPGLYEIQARAAKVGTVVVPVIIAPGRRTDVFLDATGMPSAEARGLKNPVTLPDGRVVGARAVAP